MFSASTLEGLDALRAVVSHRLGIVLDQLIDGADRAVDPRQHALRAFHVLDGQALGQHHPIVLRDLEQALRRRRTTNLDAKDAGQALLITEAET